MKPIYRQHFYISDLVVDCWGKLKLSALLYLAQEVAGQHCIALGTDYDTLEKQRLFWAVTRHRVQITRLPRRGETITLETWPMPTTRVAYPRSMVAYDESGKELFRSISVWVLMNLDSRAMVLPGKSGIHVEGTLLGSELAMPHSLLPKKLQMHCTREVIYSCLDRNGHMNNTRYLDWVDDLLDSHFHKNHSASEFIICYRNEAKEGHQLQLSWEYNEDGFLQVEACRKLPENQQSQEQIFSAQVLFTEDIL